MAATASSEPARPSVAQKHCDGVDSEKRTIWSWLAGNPRPRAVGPQSGFRNLSVIRSDAVTPVTETRTNWRCFGGHDVLAGFPRRFRPARRLRRGDDWQAYTRRRVHSQAAFCLESPRHYD